MGNELQKISGAIESQLEKTDEVIASNEAVADMISEVNNTLTSGFTMLGAGLQELCFITEDGFREVIDRLDIQNETLEAIRVILEGPLDTQAKELRKRGDAAYVNGWLDEAESDLLEAEKKNYQDFITYYILGNVYYKKKNYQKALEYYQKSVKYATVESKEYVSHASKALLRAGMVYYEIGQLSEAYKSTKLAIELTPQDSHILYNHARYAAKMGYTDEFIGCLTKNIRKDANYLITADRDEMFSDAKEEIKKLAENLRREKANAVNNVKHKIDVARKEAEALGIIDFVVLDNKLAEVDDLRTRNSYFDLLKAEQIALNAYKESLSEWIKVKEVCLGELRAKESKIEDQFTGGWSFLFFVVAMYLIGTIGYCNSVWKGKLDTFSFPDPLFSFFWLLIVPSIIGIGLSRIIKQNRLDAVRKKIERENTAIARLSNEV